jgi:ATP-dependent RNA helicase DeaD
MQDETMTQSESQDAQGQAEHKYLEVGNDLLAKPDALCQLLLVRGLPATAVFCNSPSEADMVEVMLKKNSISCGKLIGNVPHQRLIEEVTRLQNKEISVLIITDIAAQDLEIEGFAAIVNYGIHEDPEIYLHRITGYETVASLKEVISLVSPLDFGNFHYLRKVVTLDFTKEEAPSEASVAKAQSEILFSGALEGAHLEDEAALALVSSVLEHENRDQILAMLLHNTLSVIPKLKDSAQQNNREGRGRRGRDRDRNDRNDRDRGDRKGRRNDRNDRDNRREAKKDLPPPKKDARFYIGHGSDNGFGEDSLKTVLQETGIDAEVIQRLSVRELYSFLDVPEEVGEEVFEKLESAELDEKQFFIRKATLINLPREEVKEENEASTESEANDADTSEQVEQEVAQAAE